MKVGMREGGAKREMVETTKRVGSKVYIENISYKDKVLTKSSRLSLSCPGLSLENNKSYVKISFQNLRQKTRASAIITC
jgi:hypothetical protein